MFEADLHLEVPDATADAAYSIRAVQRVCDLLDLLQEDDGGTSLARAAAVAELPRSSAFRYLSTLEARHYVERNDAGDYRLGLALLPMQARRLDLMIQRVRPILARVREELDETVSLGMLDGSAVVYLEVLESRRAMRLAARTGARKALHADAMGKILAAGLDVTRVRAILQSHGMPRLTPQTIITLREYLDHLEIVREEAFALDDGETEPGGRSVAVAVEAAQLPLAICLSAPAARLPVELIPDLVDRLEQAARSIAAELAES